MELVEFNEEIEWRGWNLYKIPFVIILGYEKYDTEDSMKNKNRWTKYFSRYLSFQ